MAEEGAVLAVTLGHTVDPAPSHLQDARGAIDVLAFRRREERGVQLGGESVVLNPDARLDRQPHRAVRRRHQRGAVDDAARSLQIRPMRQPQLAKSFIDRNHLEAVGPQELRSIQELLERLLQASSSAIAVASPPPMHRLATPRFSPYLRSAPISVTTMRAPEAPIGWPSAQAPPCTFTLSCGRPCSFIAAMVTTANASLISYRSTCLAFQPVFSNSFLSAPTGAVVNQPGSCACVAWPTTVASGASPRASALARRIITSAAAPSEIELEFAAVTVPSLRNAGLSVGIFSRFALNGCSSSSTNFSSLPTLIARGAISQAKDPSLFAFCARFREAMAKSSCAWRENWYFAAQSSAKVPIRRPLSYASSRPS